jgi:inosine-uridine nucleoside N-ribohydrolase
MLHDPLAVATLVEPRLAPFARTRMSIDEDGVTRREPNGAAVEVATEVDNEALRRELLRVWLG